MKLTILNRNVHKLQIQGVTMKQSHLNEASQFLSIFDYKL